MIIDFASVLPWVSGLISIITLLTLLKNILSSGEKKLGEDLTEARKKLIEHDRRIQSIEGEIKHLPDRETTHRMELAMSEINGKLNVMAERLKPIEAIGERLQETLMEQARK
ncbi:MAG: DUF2730 family protein [Rhizobium rosettiformans]|jgi:hypothetical protein